MPDYILKKLESAAKNQELIEVYDTPGDDSSFEVGSVLWVNEELLTIRNLDKFGRPNGIVIFALEPITRIGIDSNYLRRISSDMLHHPPRNIPEVPVFSNFVKALEYFHDAKIPITIYDAPDNSVTGFVLDVEEGGFTISDYYLGGRWDGTSIFDSDSVMRIDAYGNYETNLTLNL